MIGCDRSSDSKNLQSMAAARTLLKIKSKNGYRTLLQIIIKFKTILSLQQTKQSSYFRNFDITRLNPFNSDFFSEIRSDFK